MGGRAQAGRQAAYRDYVEGGVREGLPRCPWEELRDRVVLGGAAFVAQVRGRVRGTAREQSGLARLGAARPPLAEVIARVESVRGESWRDFRDAEAGDAVHRDPPPTR